MPSNYIPASDSAFDAWQANFYLYVTGHLSQLGLSFVDVVPLAAQRAFWPPAWQAHGRAQADAEAARQLKDDSRAAFEAVIRGLVRRLQASPEVTDAQRAALGLTVPDRTRTPVAPPASRPVVTVDAAGRLRHVLHFVDEHAPAGPARPAGVRGAEIWVKVGAAPADASELRFVTLGTRATQTTEFHGTDAGKTAYYMLRWVNTRGEKGPWSATVSATVGG
jgi:hypothetical protein